MMEIRTSKSGDGLTLLNSLISNINSKQTPKRSMFSNLPFEIAPGFKISVKGYNIIHRQHPVRRCYIWLDGEKPQIAVGETTKIAEDTARTVEKTEIKKAYKFGGEYVYFSPQEQKALKDFGPPTIRIIGFKKRSMIPIWASVKKSTFIFPSEEGYVGSTRVFSSLWQKLLKDDKVGIAWYVPRVNAVPLLVAIMPSKERSDEDSGTPYLPAGLWLYPLPYVDDLRPPPEFPPVIRAPDPLIDQMRTIVQQLQLPKGIFNPTKYPNPSLQWFYKILQTLALEEEVPEKLDDPTVPKYSAISKRAGGYIEDWKNLLKQEQEYSVGVNKLKREAEAEATKTTKKAKTSQMSESGLSNVQLKAAAEGGGLSKLLVADLRDILGARGLSTAGRKVELVDRIEQWLESNS